MEYLIRVGHTTLASLIDTAYTVYSESSVPAEERHFQQYLGFTIQESYVQFESHELGFTNDNSS